MQGHPCNVHTTADVRVKGEKKARRALTKPLCLNNIKNWERPQVEKHYEPRRTKR